MNESAMWPPTDYIAPLPPLKRKMSGKPTVKRRTCSTEEGHNKSTCTAVARPPKCQVKKKKAENGGGSGLNKGKDQDEGVSGVEKGQVEGESASGQKKKRVKLKVKVEVV
ncbi:unnamed protein product [Lactuca virosa]|uniref:Uncharacterized protein n=1 Tax=Lactuca virosa TaxID=75947 RepID=A0AAU9PDC0_9ASTR|nr:unnamed protein product [Lactuca virosa]